MKAANGDSKSSPAPKTESRPLRSPDVTRKSKSSASKHTPTNQKDKAKKSKSNTLRKKVTTERSDSNPPITDATKTGLPRRQNQDQKRQKQQMVEQSPPPSPVGDVEAVDDGESVGVLEPPPPILDVVRRSEVPDDGDISTIANDTWADITLDLDINVPKKTPPMVTPIKQQQKPERKDYGSSSRKKNGGKWSSSSTTPNIKKESKIRIVLADDDDATQPETPEKDEEKDRVGYTEATAVVCSPFSGINRTSKKKEEEGASTTKSPSTEKHTSSRFCIVRSRYALCIMCLFGILLFAGIGILGYTLFILRTEDDPTLFSKSLSDTKLFGNNGNHDEEDPPQEISKAKMMENLQAMIQLVGPEFTAALTDETSLQYSVMNWLVNDPHAGTYSGVKVIQRYALGCFFWSLNNRSENGTAVLSRNIADTWMTYSDECTNWGTTAEHVCDENGRIVSLSLNDVGLSGTLASEISLLSTLETIFLTLNDIHGEIPSSLGRMTNLKRVQLSENRLEGTLPATLRHLKKLEILSASNNQLSGSLHTDLGLLASLTFLSLASNRLTGTIPSELGDLKSLDFLSLQSNLLTGEIPEQLSDLDELATLWLSENDLVGVVPSGVCDATTSAVALDLSVDCDQVDCSCCSDCFGVTPGANGEEIEVVDEEDTTGDSASDAPVVEQTASPSENVIDGSSPENITSSVPYPVDINMETPNPPDYSCYDVQVGFGCYVTGWAIDFETIMCNQRDFNLIAIFPYPNNGTTASLQAPSFVGTQLPIDEALYWSTNCEQPECDGVVADGTLYYRNQFPDVASPNMVWPLPVGQYLVRIVQADEVGTATILAESAAFKVDGQC